MTADFQPYGVFHVGLDNYFRFSRLSANSFPPDFTVPTVGVLPFSKVQMEIGTDYLATAQHPWLFNLKVGAPENAWFKGQPTLAAGLFDLGRKTRGARADYDVVYGVIGKTLARIGRLSCGPYLGNHAALISSRGTPRNKGFMAAFDRGFMPVKGMDGSVEYSKVVFASDFASGKNAIGGGGAGFYYYFNKNVSLLAGPTVFNDRGINGKWKMSTQLDINLPQLFHRRGTGRTGRMIRICSAQRPSGNPGYSPSQAP